MGGPEDAAHSPGIAQPQLTCWPGLPLGSHPLGAQGGSRAVPQEPLAPLPGGRSPHPPAGRTVGAAGELGSRVSLAMGSTGPSSSGAPAVPRRAELGGHSAAPPQPCPHLHHLGWPGLPQLLRRALRLRVTRVILILFSLLDGGGLSRDRGTPGLLFALFRDPLLAAGVRGQVRGERVVDVVGRLPVVWGDWELVRCSLPISCQSPAP